MRTSWLPFLMLMTCQNIPAGSPVTTQTPAAIQDTRIQPVSYPEGSWRDFLRHLPTADRPILDYRGRPVENQAKHVAILTYDVGTADLQQCADALIRIRAEYLFAQGRPSEIGFHFTGGGYYAFADYSKGIRPVNKGGRLIFLSTALPSEKTHQELRKYLNIAYMYANTTSLCKELKPADRFETGTVIIHPGSPGHCSLIVDEAVVEGRDTIYKLAEGFMPAQSIYILSNPYEPGLSPWYHLGKGTITTSSFEFKSYYLKKFE